MTEKETVRKHSFEEKLTYFKKNIKDFFATYKNESGCEDCIEVCLIRDGYRTVLQAEEEINRLQAENSKLKKSNRNWRRKVQRLKVKLGIKDLEYSCLERERADDICEFVEELKSVEAEAYKECFEKVKAYFRETRFAYDAENLCEELDDLLKEKIGENNDTM
mgnify:CR=1 FL=1